MDSNELVVPRSEILLLPREVVIRNYHAAKLLFPRCDAYLTITNLRAVVSGLYGGLISESAIFQQVNIANVTGVNSGFCKGIIWSRFFVLLALELLIGFRGGKLLSTVEFLTAYPTVRVFLYMFLLIFGVCCMFAFCRRSQFLLELFSAASGTPLRLGAGYGKKSALLALTGEPAVDSQKLINEVGALIEDLKTNGNEAIERWFEKGAEVAIREEDVKKEKEVAADNVKNKLAEALEYASSVNGLRWHNLKS